MAPIRQLLIIQLYCSQKPISAMLSRVTLETAASEAAGEKEVDEGDRLDTTQAARRDVGDGRHRTGGRRGAGDPCLRVGRVGRGKAGPAALRTGRRVGGLEACEAVREDR